MVGKWRKYFKRYNPNWEKEPCFKGWLRASSEDDVLKGKPEAYCSVCECNLRAHHSDLQDHAKTAKHQRKAESLNPKRQPTLHNYGCVEVSNDAKSVDLKLAVYIAMHSPVKTIDHLSELLKILAVGTPLENTRLHRTKCSKLISAVIAPAFLTELIQDIGSSRYSIIADESTDVTSIKFMALCVRYYSLNQKSMQTDFLGMLEVPNCTGEILAESLKEYLDKIGLPLKKMKSIGTDGAPNMSGAFNSMFTHLKKYVPDLELFKCICHSLDKCAEYAMKKMPDTLTYLIQESSNWFSHSAKRWNDYVCFYKETNNTDKDPKKLVKLCKTRWLIFLPSSTEILEQWNDLGEFFDLQAKKLNNFMAGQLALMFKDNANRLLLTFLKSVLHQVSVMNLAFEKTNADITRLFTDLRSLVYSLAGRVLKPSVIAETANPGVLRVDEVKMLKAAFEKAENLLPLDRINFGDAFRTLLPTLNLAPENLRKVQECCGNYLLTLCKQLLDRLPSNVAVIAKTRHFVPRAALAKLSRPTFNQLPLDLIDLSGIDRDKVENQWLLLGTMTLPDICPHFEEYRDIDSMDVIHFWSCVLEFKNAVGDNPFKELATLVIDIFTLPISNAIVERVFSFMSAIKDKARNRLQIRMLEALLRLRVHLKVNGKCCKEFQPSREMFRLFNSSMYASHHEVREANYRQEESPSYEGANAASEAARDEIEDEDYELLLAIFENDVGACVTV